MHINKISILLSALLLFGFSLTAQQYSLEKAQVKMTVTDAKCYFQTSTTTALMDVNAVDNSCSFVLPVKAFQLNEKNKQVAFKEDCFSLDGFPLITFKGELRGSDDWKAGKDGTYKQKLLGIVDIKGAQVLFSENVILLLENGQLNLAFNSSMEVGEAVVDVDFDFKLR